MPVNLATLTGKAHYDVERAIKDLAGASNLHDDQLRQIAAQVAAQSGAPLTATQLNQILTTLGPQLIQTSVLAAKPTILTPPAPSPGVPPGPKVPHAPTNLSVTVAGSTVNFSWTAAPTPPPFAYYLIFVGSAPGLHDVNNINAGLATSGTWLNANPGVYYAQVIASTVDGLFSLSTNTFVFSVGGVPVPPGPGPPPPPPPPPPGTANYNLGIAQPNGIPPAPSLRWMRGNFGGIRIPGLPNVSQGPDTTQTGGMVWTPYYDRFTDPGVRANILAQYVAHGYTHFFLSWVNSRDFGTTPAAYAGYAQEIFNAGLFPCHFIAAKASDLLNPSAAPQDPGGILADWGNVWPLISSGGLAPVVCVGWELNSWISPPDLQTLINGLNGMGIAENNGHNLYVHFTNRVVSWQLNGLSTSGFWIPNVGKLTGVLSQQDGQATDAQIQSYIADSLVRVAGNDGFPHDSGFGHPFDVVAWEYSANDEFFNGRSEATGDNQGFALICQPAITGPAGTVSISGFGNGCRTPAGTRL